MASCWPRGSPSPRPKRAPDHGGQCYAQEYAVSRVFCDARILSIFEGAAEIQAGVIARGIPTARTDNFRSNIPAIWTFQETFLLTTGDGTIWLDGRLVPWARRSCTVLTHGLHYASSVFRAFAPMAAGLCFGRALPAPCANSSRILGFDLHTMSRRSERPFTRPAIERHRGRVSAAGGLARLGADDISASNQARFTSRSPPAAWELAILLMIPKSGCAGIRLQRSRWARPARTRRRNPPRPPGLYMICTMAKHEALAAGFDDALMLDWRGDRRGNGANTPGTDRQLLTPKPDCFLDGITAHGGSWRVSSAWSGGTTDRI